MDSLHDNIDSITDPNATRSFRRGRAACVAVAVGMACSAFLLFAWPGLPMAWDEGSAILRAEGIARWTARPSLEVESIRRDWQYATAVEGHPAFGGILMAASSGLSGWCLEPLAAARLGPILLFGLAAGAMFYRMSREFSPAAAFASVAALMVMPRLLAHVHFATWDGPLLCSWVLAWATFSSARRSWRGTILFGLVLGMTLSSKATGWLAPLPFLAWAVVYRDRAALAALALAVPVALAVFVFLNPPLWHDPAGGIAEFLRLNLNRGDHPDFNISTQFLGRMYNLDYPLPWYNTLFWTAITVPVPVLLLALIGLAAALRHPCRAKAAMLLVFNWLVLVIVRALPCTPPHDGVRLFLPSFAFLAMLAGVGTAWLIAKSRKGPTPHKTPSHKTPSHKTPLHKTEPLAASQRPAGSNFHPRAILATALIVLCFLGSATSVFWYAPQWLSYYNLLIGGVRGATAAGMEPTYYWDGLDESVLRWLRQNTAADEKIRFAAGPGDNLRLLEEWSILRRDFRPGAKGKFRWYVLQRRPSGWQPADRWLMQNRRPVFFKTLGRHRFQDTADGWWAWRRDVRLVEVYAYSDYEQARRAVGAMITEESK